MTFLIRKWTVPIARRLTLRRLDKVESALAEICELWVDEDQYVVNLAECMISEVKRFRKELDENIEARALEREERDQ